GALPARIQPTSWSAQEAAMRPKFKAAAVMAANVMHNRRFGEQELVELIQQPDAIIATI
ncbi:unnamed protein product, partial [Phaeothamnion confervicola]